METLEEFRKRKGGFLRTSLNPSLISLVFWFCFVTALSFVVYLSTLSHSVYFGDSGEFIVTAYQNGVPHPPGFPLYIAIAHQFTKLPWNSIAWRVNLVSAVFGALSAGFVFGSVYLLTRHRLISAVTGLFYAFAPLFWLYSLVAEVFSLNNFFIALLLFLTIYALKFPEKTFLFPLISFVFGLGLTAHQVLFFFSPALLYLFFSLNILKNPRLIFYSIFAFIIGEIPQFYLWYAASGNPFYNWGDPDSLYRLVRHILRLDYGLFQLGATFDEQGGVFTFQFVPFYLSSVLRQLHVLIAFIPLGFLLLWKERKVFWLSLIGFLFFGPIFLWYAGLPITSILQRGVGERFHMQSLAFLFPVVGYGIFFAWEKLRALESFRFVKTFGGSLFILTLPAVLLWYYYPKVNQKHNALYEEYAKNVFATLPENSLFLVGNASTDSGIMGSTYLQQVKGERPDIKVVNFSLLPAAWYHETLKKYYPSLSLPLPAGGNVKEYVEEICKDILNNQPTFTDGWSPGFNPDETRACIFLQKGVVIQLLPEGTIFDTDGYKKENDALWDSYLLPQITSEQVFDYRTREVLYAYSMARMFSGFTHLSYQKKEWAKEEFEKAWQMSHDNGFAASGLATFLYEEGKIEEAIALEHTALSVSPYNYGSYLNLGIWYARKNEPEKAKYYLSKLLQLFPQAPDRERIQEMLESL